MQDAYSGLFGPSAQQIQQAQQQQLQQRGDQLAQMNPYARAGSMLYSGAGGLMGLAAEKMGGVNPQVKSANDTQEIQKTIDHTTSDGLLQGAAKLKDISPSLAMKYVQAAQALKEKEANIGLKKAQTERALREPAYREDTHRDYEYEKMMEIVNDPDSSPEQVAMAKARLEALNAKGRGVSAGASTGESPKQMVSTNKGLLSFDKRAGKFYRGGVELTDTEMADLQVASNDPVLQEALARTKSGGKETGKVAATAMSALPRVEMDLNAIEDLGAKLFAHPGYADLVGAGFPGLKFLAGSKVPGASALASQINSLGYLMAREDLRGQGQVTENEANAALAAYNRMNTTMSEKDFREAYSDFVQRVKNIRDILKNKSGAKFDQAPYQVPAIPAAPAPIQKPTAQPFSGVTTPQQVKTLFQSGKISREQARAILADMESQGVK